MSSLVYEALNVGVAADETAKMLRVSRWEVFEWQKARAYGAEAQRTKKTRGPESKLSGSQMSQLYRLIVGIDPWQHSFGLALWTRAWFRNLSSGNSSSRRCCCAPVPAAVVPELLLQVPVFQ
jgi:hypothetical protein